MFEDEEEDGDCFLRLWVDSIYGCCGVEVIYDFTEMPCKLSPKAKLKVAKAIAECEQDSDAAFFNINLTQHQRKVFGRIINHAGYKCVGHNLNRKTQNTVYVYLKKNIPPPPKKKIKRLFGR